MDVVARFPRVAEATDPAALRALDADELVALAGEIRAFLIENVTRTSGHLGPNLGVVELSLALHRVFDSPRDVLLWDTGHQAYVHKMLTGRADQFDTLRQHGGLSGYPSRVESRHDVIENSHASTALSYADGIAKGFERRGLTSTRAVVAVVGDGALTGGMAWEALNNIAASRRPVVIVVNDNARSYSPTIGGLARHLATLRTASSYERFLGWGRSVLGRTPLIGGPLYDAMHGMKKGVKDIVAPQGLFEDLGLKYIGPIDGHDTIALEHALERARQYGGPVIVHAITLKGKGYRPAEEDDAERFHAIGVVDPETGQPLSSGGPTWTSVFAEEIVSIGAERSDVVAITAAMQGPTGLDGFARAYPARFFDVGIAEQHAVTSAAGLAYAGLHPLVAVYSTFINRAFDQVLLDAALHRAGVTFVLDRSGVTGDDGPSHNGMWDLALLQIVPDIAIAAPRDGSQLRELLREAVAIDTGPSVVRYPKGALPTEIPALERRGGLDILRIASDPDVLVVGIGAMVAMACEVADGLHAQGIDVTVVDPRWVSPVPTALVDLAGSARLVVTIEDGARIGGVGSRIAQVLREHDVDVPLRDFGLPQQFLAHGKPALVRAEVGLTAQHITRAVVEAIARRDSTVDVVTDAVGASGDEH